ncbi:MAG: thiolase domain-containing protein [Rhodospirillaceae bacterium]|nr:MAG: thiolase domain-containing protein [Rhodospirillaceae bacterium]
MSRPPRACIAGAFEHPLRDAPNATTTQLHYEVARGALDDAGLGFDDVDAYFCDGAVPGFGPLSMIDYMGLSNVRHADATELGGSTYIGHVGRAASLIAAGKCKVALITLAGRPRQRKEALMFAPAKGSGLTDGAPEAGFEHIYGGITVALYAAAAMRHMYAYGTTSEQLAWVKVAASHHAQWNERAFLRKLVTIEDVLKSRLISDPLHLLDCCVVTDGGGALVVVAPEVARSLKRPVIQVIGTAEAPGVQSGGRNVDLTRSAATITGPAAFAEAGVKPADIKYASIYDSFTITVLIQLEDLGFCEKGHGGRFVADGGLISGVGKLPVNTDGGGLCNNHPDNRGGMTKMIEAVRQLRGEAHPKVQVPNCDLALAHGTGGILGMRHSAATAILERTG